MKTTIKTENQIIISMKNSFYNTLFIIAFALSISIFGFSQKVANNWLFGDFGLEFMTDTVAVRQNYAVHESRGMGIISDSNGRLICYTDGLTIWNKNHTIMSNGQNMSTTQSGTFVQSSAIIAKPGSNSIFYSFTVHTYNGQSAAGLYYSIIDLTKDNGLGAVTLKGKKILDKTDNKITAVLHKNGHYVWIITHQDESNKYYAYLLTDTELSETPVISTVGKSFSSTFDGQLKASPDGTKVACSYNVSYTAEGFSLFDFDNSTGKLTNPLLFSMPVTYRGCGGLEFSPDAKKLYVYQSGSTGESGLYQYNISSGIYNEINNSRTLLFQDMINSMLGMQLAPNGKIYFTKGGGQDSGTKYLGVVENPNDLGTNCVVKELGLYLDGRSAFVAQTPTFIQNYFFKTNFIVNNGCSGNLSDFKITNETNLDSVRWNFGEGSSSVSRNPQFSYNLAGKYTVTLFAHYSTKTDTIQKQITINPSPVFDLGSDRSVCYGYELSVAEGFKSYNWNSGEKGRSIIINKPGMYKLTVENEYGCQNSDSVYLNVLTLPTIELPDSIQIGTLDSIPVNAGNFKSYSWNTGETTSTIYIKNEGWYSVTVENETGCTNTKSFYVYKNNVTHIDNNEWKILNPLPSVYTGLGICLLNSQIGYLLNQNQIIGTSDGGANWKILMEITSGTQMAFKNNYGYVICSSGDIYKSTYMGIGWNKLNTGITDNLNGISVISKDTIFVTGTKKLYSSFDGGQHWNTLEITPDYINNVCFTSSTTGHVGCSNGNVYKTVDGGKTWTLKSSNSSSSNNINKMYFVDSNTGFISQGYMADLLRTTDAGENWKKINSISDEIYSFDFLNAQNGFCAGEDGVIFKTDNGGTTWTWSGFQNGRYAGTDIYGLSFVDGMTGFAVGMNGRIIKTTDGGKNWSSYAPTYNNIKQLQFASNTTTYGLVGNSFIKSSDGSKSWKNIGAPVPTGNTNQFDFIDANIGYCIAGGDINSSAEVAKVFKTTDGGKTWKVTNNGKDIISDNLYSIVFLDENTGFVSGGYNSTKTYKTTNGGTTWTQVNSYSFRQIMFLTPTIGYGRSNSYFYKTVDGGNTWQALTIPVDYSGIASFDFTNENNGYIAGSRNSEIFKTTDGGSTWQKLTVPYGYYINVKFKTPNIGYITDDYGTTHQTTNGGVSWIKLSKPYSVKSIEMYADEIYGFGGSGIIMKKKIEYKPAVLTINPATSITNNSVTLSGNATSNNQLIKNIQFEYGTGPIIDTVDFVPDSVLPNCSLNYSLNLNDLKADQTYSYRLSANSNGTQYYSETLQFKTLADYNIGMIYVYNTTSNESDISGTVVSNAKDITDIEFQYGTDTAYTYNIAAQPAVVSAGKTQTITAHINSLNPLTNYFLRIKGIYNGKVVYSSPIIFKTQSPYIISLFSPYITGNNALLNIYIKANKDTIQNIALEYGTTREYKNKVDITGQIPKGTYNYVSAQLTGLDSATVYYYRIKANMGSELIYGSENILKLNRGIVMIPIEHKQLSDSSIVLQGLLNSNGSLLTNIRFQYGLTENFSDSIIAIPYNIYNVGTNLVSSTIYRLSPSVNYYARLTATNGLTRYYSDLFKFRINANVLDSITDSSGVLIFPNPATNYLTINSIKKVDKVEIYDSFGKLSIISGNQTKINISQLPKGINFIRIYTEDKVVTKKLIKN